MVAEPNEWSKAVRELAISADLGDTQKLRTAYWDALKEYLVESASRLRISSVTKKYWLSFAIGRSGFHLSALVSARDGYVAAKLRLTGVEAHRYFMWLEKDREQIDRELGEAPVWDRREERDACEVVYQRTADPTDRSTWPELHRWTREKLEALDKAFRVRITSLPRLTPLGNDLEE